MSWGRMAAWAASLTLLLPVLARAQHASDNPVLAADDAFGLTLGLESTGIYNPGSIRGFNPQTAGNARIDGLYFDQQGSLTDRVIEGSTIRVGNSEIDYAFPAPTGIVDYDLRRASDGKPTASVIAQAGPYAERSISVDGSLPLIGKQLQLPMGAELHTGGQTQNGNIAGYESNEISVGATPQWTPNERVTIRGLFDWQHTTNQDTVPFVFTGGNYLPPRTPRKYLGQRWMKGHYYTENFGGTIKAQLSTHWSLAAGLFRSIQDNGQGYADLYVDTDITGLADHLLVATPDQRTGSTSGEVRLTGHLRREKWYENLVFMVRGRDEGARYGGSAVVDSGPAYISQGLQAPEPVFDYTAVTQDRTRIWSVGAAYQVRRAGLGGISFGIQKEHYEKQVETPGLGSAQLSADPWRLYGNASAPLWHHLSAYAGYTQGFEDSGAAPNTAANRGTILPTSYTWQADGGLRYQFSSKLSLIIGYFNVNRPYFNFDTSNVDRNLGMQRASGLEVSMSGRVVSGLDVNIGGVFGTVKVHGPDLAAQGIGAFAVGQPRDQFNVNLNYAFPWWPRWSMDANLNHFGSVPAVVSDAYYDGSATTVNVGSRYRFTALGKSASLRVLMQNIGNYYFWNIGYSPGFLEFAPRSLMAYLTVDL